MRPWVIMAQNYSHLLWEVTPDVRKARGGLQGAERLAGFLLRNQSVSVRTARFGRR